MRAPTKPRPVPNPIHLYRQLLREATYLPPVCRAQIEPHIQLRFRKNRHVDGTKAADRLYGASRDLRRIQMANQGDMPRMRRMLLITFGRVGWRRHQLMADLLRPDQPDDTSQLQEQLETKRRSACTRAHTDWLDQWDTEKLLVFGKDQSKQKLHSSPRPQFTTTTLDPKYAVPQSNVWGRSLRSLTARAKEQRWWKKFASRILPPLPRGEWELLQKLATGTAGSEWDLPAKRTPAQPLVADASKKRDWNWEQYALRPTRVVERQRARLCAQNACDTQSDSDVQDGPRLLNIHDFTPRFWRRMYADVWRLTAVMERVPHSTGTKRWKITWGGLPPKLNQPGQDSLEFFEGVDAKGARLDQPVGKKHAERPSPKPV